MFTHLILSAQDGFDADAQMLRGNPEQVASFTEGTISDGEWSASPDLSFTTGRLDNRLLIVTTDQAVELVLTQAGGDPDTETAVPITPPTAAAVSYAVLLTAKEAEAYVRLPA